MRTGPGPLLLVFLVFAGGALGAGLREALVVGVPTHPLWVVLAINLAGAAVLAAVAARWPSGPRRVFLGTGVCGGFTTYSAFAVQGVQLVHEGRAGVAAAYVILTVVGGVLAVLLGERGVRT